MTFACLQKLLSPSPEEQAVLEYLCQESNKVYNCALYFARQVFFKANRFVNRAELCSEMVKSKNKHFGAMYVSSAQQTCNAVAEAFKSFKALQKLWLAGKLENKPALPKYRKQGLYTVSYPVRWLK